MLFFYNRVLLAAIIAFTFLQFTFARPVPNLHVEHGPSARKEIASFGLKGQHAIAVKNWHKNQVIHAMKNHPDLKGKAHSAVIHHTAHQGGSDPNEKNHITASFYDKHGKVIHNKFNGGRNHHVFVPKNNAGQIKQGKKALKRANVAIRRKSRGKK